MPFRRVITALALLVSGPLAAQNVSEVQVAPPSVTLRVGERSGLLATAFDRIGNVIPTIRFIWSSNNVNVARVDNNGTVTGVGGGAAIIEARVGARRGQAVVQVLGPPASVGGGAGAGGAGPPPPPPGHTPDPGARDAFAGQPAGTGVAAALRIEPATVFLLPSENARITLRALREDGAPAAPVRVTWKSLREDIASVDQSGNVIALAAGQGVLQAIGLGGLTATAPVVVQQADIAIAGPSPRTLSPGQIDTVRVVVPAQSSRLVNPLQLQWASSDPLVVRVSLNGVVTAVGPGRATLAVRGLLQTASVEVVVHRPVELLVVRPRSSAEIVIPLAGRQKFEAAALAADNTPVREAPLRWSTSDTAIATFDTATGMLTARAAGTTQLTVRGPVQGLAVTWNVNIVISALRLTAHRVGIALNERHTLRANYLDSSGAVIASAANLAWASDRPDVATVSDDGTVTGVGHGRARVVAATPGGRADTAEVFVQGELLVASTRGGTFQLYALERSNLAQLRRVSEDPEVAYEPAYGPDGSRVAFVSTRNGNPEIYVADADGGSPVRLTTATEPDGHPAFTPDGQTVAFHSLRTRTQQIFTVSLDGSNLRQLTQEPGANLQPTVSPDGSTIAFSSAREGNYDIWLMARDGTQQRAFTKSAQSKETYPRYLRDGTLAYLQERREGARVLTQVIKADLTTGQTTPLTGTDLLITSFAISPAGDLLALVVSVPGAERRANPLQRVYVQPIGAGPVPIPAAGGEQITTPAFQP